MRQLEFSRSPALSGPGKRAVFIAEQFAFHQVPGQRAAVDRHERAFGTGAGLVNRLRDHFLAGAALPLDQDSRHAVGGNLGQSLDFDHAGAFADDVVECEHGGRADHAVDQFSDLFDFPENINDAFQAAVLATQRNRRLDEMQHAAFRFNKKLLVRVTLTGFQHPQHHRLEVDQFLDMFADRFLRLYIKNLGAGRIDKRHGALSVDHQQPVRDRVNDRRMQPGGVFQLLLRPAHLDHVIDRRCRRYDHSQRVRMGIFLTAGHTEHTHDFAAIIGQWRCRTGPVRIRLAIMLIPKHLNRSGA